MINYQEAINIISAIKTKADMMTLQTENTVGFTCGEAIFSPEALPAFHNSAMDGYSLASKDTQNADIASPVNFKVLGCIGAGDNFDHCSNTSANMCCEIMTGAPIPSHHDAVIRLEDVTLSKSGKDNIITVNRQVREKENCRAVGEDFLKNELIISAGEIIKPRHIMALSALGIGKISVKRKPKIAVICTGKELADEHESTLNIGQIRNSNGPYLKAIIPSMGAELQYYDTLADDPAQFKYALQNLINSPKPPDIILTTGGVSAGRWDFIPNTLNELDIETIFHKVKIRPGKPVLFAKSNDSYIFGLPGNPISTAIGMRFFVYPLIRRFIGLPTETPLKAALTSNYSKKPLMRFFTKGYVMNNSMGQMEVDILLGQESFKIKPLLQANCWVALQEQSTNYKKNDMVDIFPLLPTGEYFEKIK